MDQVTQQNSAQVEENAASAQTLERQAAALGAEVGAFKLYGREQQAIVAPRAVAAPRAPVAAKTAGGTAAPPAKRTAPVVQRGARSMQTALAAAVNEDDWKNF